MKLVLVMFSVFLIAPLLRGDDASKQAKIEELLVASHVSELLQQQQGRLRVILHQAIVQSAPNLENSPPLAQFKQTVIDDVLAAVAGMR